MDLLAITPTKTAKFKFLHPETGAEVKTATGKDMFVEILGTHTKEFQSFLLEKHQRTVAICGVHNHTDDKEMSEECKAELDKSQTKFLCSITEKLLIEIDKKESTHIGSFYSNPGLEYWVAEVGKFADNTANFIKA